MRVHVHMHLAPCTLCLYVSLCVWKRDTHRVVEKSLKCLPEWPLSMFAFTFFLPCSVRARACVRAQSRPLISALSCMAPCDTSDSHKHRAVTPYIFTPCTPQSFPLSFCLFLPLSFSLLCIYWCVKLFWDGGMDSSLMGWVEAWAFCSIIDWGCMCIRLLK